MKINNERSLVWLLYSCTGGHFDPVVGCVDASLVCSDSFALATNFALTGKDNHLLELHHEGNTPLWIVPGDVVSVAFAQDGNGYCWTDDIAHFTRQSIRYCLTNTMELFADIIAEDERFEQNAGRKSQCGGRSNLLEKLNTTFTRQDAILVRRAEHMSDDPSDMLRKWIHRGYVVRNDDTTYSKTPLYLNRQNP